MSDLYRNYKSLRSLPENVASGVSNQLSAESTFTRFTQVINLLSLPYTPMSAQHTTIRAQAQAKKPRTETKQGQASGARLPADGRERMDKEIVKAVLASPLIVPW